MRRSGLVSKGYGAITLGCNPVWLVAVLLLAATAASAEPVRVVILGDSLTAGYGLPPEDGLVPQLQRWLDERGADVAVINAGVSGDTTAGGLARLDWTLDSTVDALVIELGANDMLRGIDPASTRANLEAIIARATDLSLPVLLVGFQALANFGPDYKTAFDSIYPDLSAGYGTFLMPSFFAPLAPDGAAATAQPLMQADGLHPNAQGVSVIVDVLGPHVVALATVSG